MEILLEDNHLLAANKLAGMLTQASGTTDTNLEDLAKEWVKDRYQKPGAVFLHVVHRLDKPASGIVLMARTSKALSRLNAALRAKVPQKIYYALVCGTPQHADDTLEHYLTHESHHAEVVAAGALGASIARLRYQVITSQRGLTLVRIELETGRYHQIRAQMAAIGCPILGDLKYGGNAWQWPDRIALHHETLTFPHPITKQMVTVSAPLPSYWPQEKQ